MEKFPRLINQVWCIQTTTLRSSLSMWCVRKPYDVVKVDQTPLRADSLFIVSVDRVLNDRKFINEFRFNYFRSDFLRTTYTILLCCTRIHRHRCFNRNIYKSFCFVFQAHEVSTQDYDGKYTADSPSRHVSPESSWHRYTVSNTTRRRRLMVLFSTVIPTVSHRFRLVRKSFAIFAKTKYLSQTLCAFVSDRRTYLVSKTSRQISCCARSFLYDNTQCSIILI